MQDVILKAIEFTVYEQKTWTLLTISRAIILNRNPPVTGKAEYSRETGRWDHVWPRLEAVAQKGVVRGISRVSARQEEGLLWEARCTRRALSHSGCQARFRGWGLSSLAVDELLCLCSHHPIANLTYPSCYWCGQHQY
jgi:hypothetical protein